MAKFDADPVLNEAVWRKQLTQIVETIPAGVVMLDPAGRIVFANPEAARILGVSVAAMIGRRYTDSRWDATTANGEPLPAANDAFTRVVNTLNPVYSEEYEVRRPDGSQVVILVNTSPLISDEGQLTAVIASFVDITDRKRAEAELKEAKRLSDALNNMNLVMASTLDPDEIMRRVVIEACRAFGSEATAIVLRQRDRWVLACVHGPYEQFAGTPLTDEEAGPTLLATETGEAVIATDAARDSRISRAIVERFQVKSIVVVPLAARGTLIGGLGFTYHSTTARFTDAQIDFALKLAASMSLAIENARLITAGLWKTA